MGNKNKYFIALIIIIAILLGLIIGQSISDYKNKSVNQSQNVNINTSTTPDIPKINLNTATQRELESLDGIGKVKALKIIENRPYTNVSQLLNVIGETTYSKTEDQVEVK